MWRTVSLLLFLAFLLLQSPGIVAQQVRAPGVSTVTETQLFTPAGGQPKDYFGSVAMSGDRAVVGAPGWDFGAVGFAGVAYELAWSGTEWAPGASFIGSGLSGDTFGNGVAVDGDVAAVGESGHNPCGAVHVLRYESESMMWMHDAVLEPPVCGPGVFGFGFQRLALAGGWLVVGAPNTTVGGEDYRGVVYIYRRTETDSPSPRAIVNWPLVQTLSIGGGQALDNYGYGVAISGNTLVVSAPGFGDTGAIYAYTLIGNIWTETTRLEPWEPVQAGTGAYIDFDGSTLVSTSWSSSIFDDPFVFYFDGTEWWPDGRLDIDAVVSRVAVRNGTVVLGHSRDDYASVFVRDGGTARIASRWRLRQRLEPSDRTDSKAAAFGYTVAMDSRGILVGASNWDDPLTFKTDDDRGAAFYYPWAVTIWGATPSTGPLAGGTQIRIWGQGFANGATVSVGGNPATDVTVSNDTTLLATVPARSTAEAVDIVVSTPGGATGTLEDGYTYADANLKALPITGPLGVGHGETFTITDRVRNLGPHAVPTTMTYYYLSVDNVLSRPGEDSSADYFLGSREVPAIAAKATNTGSTPLTIPDGLEVGNYYLIVWHDATNVVQEKSETDNTKAKLIRVGADLLTSSLTAPAKITPGTDFVISNTVTNKGPGQAGASRACFWLSVDKLLSPEDIVLGSRNIGVLAKGKTDKGTVTTSTLEAAGKYFLLAQTDCDEAVPELNEANNLKAKPITIQ